MYDAITGWANGSVLFSTVFFLHTERSTQNWNKRKIVRKIERKIRRKIGRKIGRKLKGK